MRFKEGRIVVASSLGQLEAVFSKVSDPRKARGVRHPFSGIVSLVFLGLVLLAMEPAVDRSLNWLDLFTILFGVLVASGLYLG